MFKSLKAKTDQSAKLKRANHTTRRQVEIDALRKKQFFSAAKFGEIAKFRWYLEQGYHVDMVENESRRDTALIAACRLGREETVQIALEYDAKNDPHPEFGQTALQVAVSSGHKTCVQMILETAALSKADHIIVNHEDNAKEAPLHVASRCGNLEILELLMQHGANIFSVDACGRTCLHCAVQSGRKSCLQYLLQVGGDVIIEERNDQGLTSLHVAVKQGNLSCAETLLQGGADTRSITPDGLDVLQLAKSRKSRKLIDIVHRFKTVESSPRKNWNGEDLFHGLDVFQSPPRGAHSDPNAGITIDVQANESQSLSPITHYTGAKSCDVPDYDMHAESFYYDNQLWFTFFHWVNGCSHPYFSRAFDNHSQWEHPRYSGIIGAAQSNFQMNDTSEPIQSTGVAPSAHANPHHPGGCAYQYSNSNLSEVQIEGEHSAQFLSPGTEWCATHPANIYGAMRNLPANNVQEIHPHRASAPVNSLMFTKAMPLQHPLILNVSHEISSGASVKQLVDQITADNRTIQNDTSGDLRVKATAGPAQNQSECRSPASLPPIDSSAQQSSSNSVTVSSLGNLNSIMRNEIETHEVKKSAVTPCKEDKKQSNDLRQEQSSTIDTSKYKRMLAMGVPLNSVAHKMNSDGVAKHTIDNFEKENTTKSYKLATKCEISLTKEDIPSPDTKSKKYTKMLLLGIPLEALVHKMAKDGVDKDNVEAFKIANDDTGTRQKELPPPKYNGEAKIIEAKEVINKDPSLTKYKKMLSVGIPVQSVANKMRQDGVARDTIQIFEVAHGLVKSASRSPLRQLNLPCPPVLQAKKRRTSVAMQKIHWKPVSQDRLQHSLWANVNEGETSIDDVEVKELEHLFAKKMVAKQQKKPTASETKKMEKVSLIDAKRSYNIAISIAQFKSFQTYDDLCAAVVSLDSSKLNCEQLQRMTALLPSQDEIKSLREYKGQENSLGRAEKFLLAISRIPNFSQKLQNFAFILQFPDIANELREALIGLGTACKDIVNNKNLANIMKRLLAIGNLLNEGAGNPKAAGITLDSLLKTATKTGTDGKTKVIDVVVANFMKQGEGGHSIEFWTELKNVNNASRIDLLDCKNSLRKIRNGMNRVKQAHDAEANDPESSQAKELEMNDSGSNIFTERCGDFITGASQTLAQLELALEATEEEFNKLCLFFAEDPSTCKAPSIFEVIMNFSQIVLKSRETWTRRARATKRRDKMNTSTPLKTPAKQPTKHSPLLRDKPRSSQQIDSQRTKNASVTKGEDFSKDGMLKARLQMRKSTSEKANKNLFEGDGKIGAWEE